MTLTPKQQRFVEEYLVDLNATRAAIRAGYSARTAEQQGARLLVNVKVAAAIRDAMEARSARVEITQDMVLERWWQIATADPNALIQYRRNCCRYCHGKKHGYQWIDAAEFASVVAAIQAATKGDQSPAEALKNDGGYGFSPVRKPHPQCPKCFGEGVPDVHAADTRQLSGAAKLLYAGVKVTQSGFELKMHDQGRALEHVARHLGMFKEKLEVEVVDRAAAIAAARKRVRDGKGG